ncbi:hypothetical protein ACLKA6_012024 [Drosophila palustris]
MIYSFSNCSTSTTFNLNADGKGETQLPLILSGKYFKIVNAISETNHQKSANGVVAACQVCPKLKKIRGSLKVTSNFINHLKERHHNENDEFLIEKDHSSKRARKGGFRQSDFDEKVLKFVVDTCVPLSTVDHPSFSALFDNNNVVVPGRKKLTKMLDDKFEFHKLHLIEKVKCATYVCTTADIWSAKRRSFFGYTCHGIDHKFERHSVALACTRMPGSLTADKIAEVMRNINNTFMLTGDKIVCTITDNGSNFVKAFKDFGVKVNYNVGEEDEDSDSEDELLQSVEPPIIRLPKHYRCASHTLNLLATTDYINIIKSDLKIHELHMRVLTRCSALWNKCNRPKSAEFIKNHLGCSLKTPCPTRWNTLYDSFQHLHKHKDQLEELCNLLGVAKLNSREFQYIEEYCQIMEPLATGLDFLQVKFAIAVFCAS